MELHVITGHRKDKDSIVLTFYILQFTNNIKSRANSYRELLISLAILYWFSISAEHISRQYLSILPAPRITMLHISYGDRGISRLVYFISFSQSRIYKDKNAQNPEGSGLKKIGKLRENHGAGLKWKRAISVKSTRVTSNNLCKPGLSTNEVGKALASFYYLYNTLIFENNFSNNRRDDLRMDHTRRLIPNRSTMPLRYEDGEATY